MNTPKTQEAVLRCPFCNTEQQHNLYPVVDLVKNPSLKLGLLTDSLFSVRCTECNNQFAVMHEMLVLDKETSFAILLAPDSRLSEIKEPSIEVKKLETLRLVNTPDELKEKILLLDAGLDDKTIELCKMYLIMKMERPEYTLLYADHQVVEEQLLFTLFNEKGEMEETIQCSDGLYTQLLRTAEAFSLKPGFFLRIDQSWALREIKNSAG
ncbi:MAG TPA: CpXC domain-containing protein [Sphaerochaeta sp.]|nr:CpXC domain-containing protein [Sphaerochaeta sp.]